jgi:hypothetical protein
MDPRQHDDLVTALRAAARELAGRPSIRDLEETLGQIVTSAVAAIPGVDARSISITEHGRIETRHPTTEAGPRPPRPADVPAARQTSPSSSGVS